MSEKPNPQALHQGNVVSVASGNALAARGERSLGAVLVRAGRLTQEDVARIVWLQNEKGLLFGDAALELGLLTHADIDFALLQQFNYPILQRGVSPVSEELFAAYTSSGADVEALRALRSQLTMRWFDGPDRNALAIVSAERHEGRSFVVANLAIMFSLLGARTLLVDADMRNPYQHTQFGIGNRVGLSALLSGRGGADTIQGVQGLPDLAVLPAGILPPNPLELLAQPRFAQLMKEFRAQYDAILLDTPAASECVDAQTIAVRAGAALIVARKNAARMWRLRGMSDDVSQASITILGTVLNDC